jgi:hypothetical protein
VVAPEFPSNFAAESDSKVSGDLFPVNFFTPHSILADSKQASAAWACLMDGLAVIIRLVAGVLPALRH